MAQRYKVTKRLNRQGSVDCFEGMDNLNGLPVHIYQFAGRPLKGSDNLASSSIPDILSVRSDGERTQLIVNVLPGFKEVANLDSVEDCEQLVFDTAQALADAAQENLRHGDICERRVLTDGSSFKLEGYGVAWSVDSRQYPSPEGDVGLAADAYAWGKTMQAILADKQQHISAGIRHLIERCVIADPEQRLSAGAILDELHNLSFDATSTLNEMPTTSVPASPEADLDAAPSKQAEAFSFSFDSPASEETADLSQSQLSSKQAGDIDFAGFSLDGTSAPVEAKDNQSVVAEHEGANSNSRDQYEELFAADFGISGVDSAPTQDQGFAVSGNMKTDTATNEHVSTSSGFSDFGFASDDDDGFAIDIDDDVQQPINSHTPPPAVVAMPVPEGVQQESLQAKEERQKMKTTFVKGPPPGATVKVGEDNNKESRSTVREPYFAEEDIAKKKRRPVNLRPRFPMRTITGALVALVAIAGLVWGGMRVLPYLTQPLPPVEIQSSYSLIIDLLPVATPLDDVGIFVISAPSDSNIALGDRLAIINQNNQRVAFDRPGVWSIQARELDGDRNSSTLTFRIPQTGFAPNSSAKLAIELE